MFIAQVGSYVTHAKLPELGTGEIMPGEDGRICIRFASGDLNFLYDLVAPHLTITTEAPPRPLTKAKRATKAKSKA